ncbi:amidohydrolase family protein [Saccharopolyspora sp. HNM0983]|uniref:Amidohydrolase family protein n=1 Tax=Saccharopolyspora montiporae TaxID=2781240 RepID=A0A929FXV5_9PSEU|nr:amidohydrolase family protein [Saccharopolyspora sp. HNM0983]MBE9372830.1 amidohydrolase family protein [Saccharopolyspora sp. HNM0983]
MPQQLLVTAGEVYPGRGTTPITDGAVLVDGPLISAVGARPDIEARATANVARFDFPGGTILPGLIDGHVHLAFDPTQDPPEALRHLDDETLLREMADRAGAALRAGITTMRDLGDRGGLAVRLRDEIARGDRSGPRVLAAGTPLTPPGGHCWFLGGEVAGSEEIRRRITSLTELGVDVIKVMVSGGHITPDSRKPWEMQFTAEELRRIVDISSELQLPVAAHAHGTTAIAACAEAGVSTVEHCTWMRIGDNPEIEERLDVAERMAERGICACPAWPSDWRSLLDALGADVGKRAIEKMVRMRDIGVPLIAGTDAGVVRSEHGGLPAGLELYRHLGMAPHEILDMATTDSATALGIGDRAGRLAAGYDADILVCDGAPLTDITALQAQRLVLARGTTTRP